MNPTVANNNKSLTRTYYQARLKTSETTWAILETEERRPIQGETWEDVVTLLNTLDLGDCPVAIVQIIEVFQMYK